MSEKKQEDISQMEKAAEALERKIVKFTNIDNESFTHAFRGVSTTIQAGASQIMRFPEGDHLATHLARKILAREKKANLKKTQGVQLWNDKSVADLKSKILTQIVTQDAPEKMNEQELHKKDSENINKTYGDSPKKKDVEVTKNDVIKDLESRGAKVDASKSKEELLAELMELEAQGKTGDE